MPDRHWSPLQQPLQDSGLHPVSAAHWLPLHSSGDVQVSQASPPDPHALRLLPGIHTAPRQQPEQVRSLQLDEPTQATPVHDPS